MVMVSLEWEQKDAKMFKQRMANEEGGGCEYWDCESYIYGAAIRLISWQYIMAFFVLFSLHYFYVVFLINLYFWNMS